MREDRMPPGVTAIEHTADVGLEVRAPRPQALFERAAHGMAWLIDGDHAGSASPREALVRRPVELSASDLPALLRTWLRELLHLHQVEGLAFRDARFGVLTDDRLTAELALVPAAPEPIREIKGVTLHGLVAESRGDTWVARVIFDV